MLLFHLELKKQCRLNTSRSKLWQLDPNLPGKIHRPPAHATEVDFLALGQAVLAVIFRSPWIPMGEAELNTFSSQGMFEPNNLDKTGSKYRDRTEIPDNQPQPGEALSTEGQVLLF